MRNVYCPSRKLGEGNVFTGVCLSTGVGISGPMSFPGMDISGPMSFLGMEISGPMSFLEGGYVWSGY